MTVVRRATPDDARAIAQVVVDAWRAAYIGVMPQALLDSLDVDEHERNWRIWTTNPRFAVFVAERGGRVVGFASAGPTSEPAVGRLYAINVAPASWGSGAGAALLDAAVEWLGKRHREAVLWVATGNDRARRFYERFGWVTDGEQVEDFGGTDVHETRYRLSGLGRL